MSRTSVRPVLSTQMTVAEPPQLFPRRDVPGMAGTAGGLCLRLCQFVFTVVSLCVLITTPEFMSIPAFGYLIAAVALQSLWSLSLAFADTYALLVRRSFRNYRAVGFFAIGDVATSTLTFAAACSLAGMTIVMGNGFYKCYVNHCTRFMLATAMAILSWLATSPSFLLNFWTLVTLSHDIAMLYD